MRRNIPQAKSHSCEWLFYIRAGLFGLLLVALAGCAREDSLLKLGGQTMGTTWSVTLLLPSGSALDEQQIQADVGALLESVNASMSTYRADSEISRFNRSEVGQWFPVSDGFYQVLSAAMAIGWQSGGAYDVTVGPLVNLWGFGPPGEAPEPPAEAAINSAMARVGQDYLQVDGEGQRLRKDTDVYLDFSSIAKGFAVDEIARYLTGEGISNYMVEVGGEMRLSGHSPRGDSWRIAIEQPEVGKMGIARTIYLGNVAVATSGDYRNFFEVDGVRYSHSIDPRSGQPVAHELVSVTVVHPSAMLADAWATALTVLGEQEALTVAQAQGLAVYLIQRQGQGFSSRYSEAFAPYLQEAPARQQ
ncbi:FAD:protein FMN transferase [Seongchinamella unica]|uniref:FAD:protein FMN transferase n=1 Tax=Seongchinamella unica TaxID=2547392 RepID=A0A4V2ZXC9_9GAMM|nr:FAD:protein FMN transferase [Seongchinamella unica]TDG14004.1 FAD:protein FMN transferase [Seongchinamella unica]